MKLSTIIMFLLIASCCQSQIDSSKKIQYQGLFSPLVYNGVYGAFVDTSTLNLINTKLIIKDMYYRNYNISVSELNKCQRDKHEIAKIAQQIKIEKDTMVSSYNYNINAIEENCKNELKAEKKKSRQRTTRTIIITSAITFVVTALLSRF